MRDDRFKVTVDDSMRLITIRLRGSDTSAYYADKMMTAYEGVQNPWTYNRLLDYRTFSGIIEAEDVERLAAHWASVTEGHTYSAKIAVLTKDVLTPKRANGFGYLFPQDTIRIFDDLHTALDWLNSKPSR